MSLPFPTLDIEAHPISSVLPPSSPFKRKREDSPSDYFTQNTSLIVNATTFKEFIVLDPLLIGWWTYFQKVGEFVKCSTNVLYMLMKLQLHNVPLNFDFQKLVYEEFNRRSKTERVLARIMKEKAERAKGWKQSILL